MSATVSQPVVRHNFDASRFDVYVDGATAGHLQYEMHQGEMWVLSTVVKPHYRKTCVGQALIREALENAHRRRLAVMPFCRLTRAFLTAQPPYLQLVPPAQRERFKLLPSQLRPRQTKRGTRRQLTKARATGKAAAA
jgi:predicted GNAT family acetyltransferase